MSLATGILTSPPGYMELLADRDRKEFSASDVHDLISHASDALYREARVDRRDDAVRLFLENALGHLRTVGAPERVKQIEEVLLKGSFSDYRCLGDRRRRSSSDTSKSQPPLLPEYEGELIRLQEIIPRSDPARRGSSESTEIALQENYPDLPDGCAAEMATRAPGEAAYVLLSYRHGIAEKTVRDRLTDERRRRKRATAIPSKAVATLLGG